MNWNTYKKSFVLQRSPKTVKRIQLKYPEESLQES